MKKRFLLFSVIIFSAFSVKDEYSFNRDYVKDARILADSCKDKFRHYLIPMGLEDDSTIITQAYQLDISFDTNLIDKDELDRKFYIGLIYNNDTNNKDILEFDSKQGRIHFCYTIDDNTNLFVYNGRAFWNDFKPIKKIDCLKLDPNIQLDSGELNGYQVVIDRNTWRGKWVPDTLNFSKFKETNLNRIWKFSDALSVKTVELINDRDTIISKYIFDSNTMSLYGFDSKFYVLTETKKCLVFYDFKNKTHHVLFKK